MPPAASTPAGWSAPARSVLSRAPAMRAASCQTASRLPPAAAIPVAPYSWTAHVKAMPMADTIVMLRNGIVEQVGSPLKLYTRPRDRFVAGFIGSPQMNFLRGEVMDLDGYRLMVAAGGARLTVELGAGVRLAAGAICTVGIRPECLTWAADGPSQPLSGHASSSVPRPSLRARSPPEKRSRFLSGATWPAGRRGRCAGCHLVVRFKRCRHRRWQWSCRLKCFSLTNGNCGKDRKLGSVT